MNSFSSSLRGPEIWMDGRGTGRAMVADAGPRRGGGAAGGAAAGRLGAAGGASSAAERSNSSSSSAGAGGGAGAAAGPRLAAQLAADELELGLVLGFCGSRATSTSSASAASANCPALM